MVNDGKKPLADESRIRKLVERSLEEEEKLAAGDQARDGNNGGGDDDNDPAPPEFVTECLYANELGDGMLYAALKKGQYVFNKSTDEWLRWAGHHWEIDEMGRAVADVEDVCRRYLDEAQRLVDEIAVANKERAAALTDRQKHIYKRVTRLRSQRGRVNCLHFAATNPINALEVSGDDLDNQTMALSGTNGVINLRTGDLRPGRPDDYILKASPVEYTGVDTPAPLWGKTLLEIFNGDQELVDFLGRIVGYAITGKCTLAKLPILWGKGRNGKGLIVETISKVLGPLAGPVPSELLLDQGRARSSGAPSADIMALQGMLVVFGSESDEGRRFSPSRVKWLTGNDTLVGRAPHDKRQTSFKPKHTLIMLTNAKPHAPADDFAFWERVLLIPFTRSYVDREPAADDEVRADLDLPEKLKAEYPGILAWMVRGCLAWQKRGLDPPAVVREATAAYRREEDLMADFLDERCVFDKHAEVRSTIFYDDFVSWWERNMSRKVPSHRKFGQIMKQRFKWGRESSGVFYYGVGLSGKPENVLNVP